MACFFEEGTEFTMERGNVRLFSQDTTGSDYFIIDDMVFYVEDKDDFRIRTFPGNKWPGGVVYYQFAANVSAANKVAFKSAAKLWSDVAKVSFTEKADTNGYVLVESSTTLNRSTVGFAKIAGQEFKILSWNNHYVIAHEIAHTLGMTHEHMRSDRDGFVKIHFENIEPGKDVNFDPKVTSTNYSTYDYESVMHYPYDAFGIELLGVVQQTISVKPPNVYDEKLLGQRSKLSDKDKADMKAHYGNP